MFRWDYAVLEVVRAIFTVCQDSVTLREYNSDKIPQLSLINAMFDCKKDQHQQVTLSTPFAYGSSNGTDTRRTGIHDIALCI